MRANGCNFTPHNTYHAGFKVAYVPKSELAGLPSKEEFRANAQLIAKSPQMANRLNQIGDIIVNHYSEEDEPFPKKELKQILDSICEVLDANK